MRNPVAAGLFPFHSVGDEWQTGNIPLRASSMVLVVLRSHLTGTRRKAFAGLDDICMPHCKWTWHLFPCAHWLSGHCQRASLCRRHDLKGKVQFQDCRGSGHRMMWSQDVVSSMHVTACFAICAAYRIIHCPASTQPSTGPYAGEVVHIKAPLWSQSMCGAAQGRSAFPCWQRPNQLACRPRCGAGAPKPVCCCMSRCKPGYGSHQPSPSTLPPRCIGQARYTLLISGVIWPICHAPDTARGNA